MNNDLSTENECIFFIKKGLGFGTSKVAGVSNRIS